MEATGMESEGVLRRILEQAAGGSETISVETRFPDGTARPGKRECLKEHNLDILVNEMLMYRLVCTGQHLKELVYGRLYIDGIISGREAVKLFHLCKTENTARVLLDHKLQTEQALDIELSCCSDNHSLLRVAGARKLSPLPAHDFEADQVFYLTRLFQEDSALHISTEAVHRCILLCPAENGQDITFTCEDIGRHNAVDKAVGFAVLEGINLQNCVLFTSGRVPVDMARKVIAAGIPVLVTKSAPTSDAVQMAREYGLTLACRAWPDSFELFAGGE